MIDRRGFLALAGAGLAELALDGCAPVPLPTGPAYRGGDFKQLCQAYGKKGDDPLWGAALRGQFRSLECMTSAILAVPSFEEVMAKEIKKRYWKLHQDLAGYTYSRTIAETWRSFYDLTARLHMLRNERSRKSKLPVYAYNGHQHAARMWVDEQVRKSTASVLLHFDTHDDMRALNHPAKIVSAVKRMRQGGKDHKKGLRDLVKLIHDHATPVSGGVLGKGVTDLVWAFPYWAYSSEFHQRPCFYANVPYCKSTYGTFRLLHDRGNDTGGLLPTYSTAPWLEVSSVTGRKLRGMSHKCDFRMTFVQTYKLGTAAEKKKRMGSLLEAVPKGRFVLDIDLDYFMSIDSSSGFHRYAASKSGGSKKRQLVLNEYEKRLRKARKLLDKRLSAFGDLLEELRDKDRIPSLITIADSTYLPFASSFAGKSYWEYMPYEFAGYMHWNLRRVLAKVYQKQGIDAGV